MIVPADMPRLTTVDCKALLAAHAAAPAGRVSVPFRGKGGSRQRGNPIILPAEAVAGILDGGVNLGCRGLLEKQPERLFPVEMTSDGFLSISTPLRPMPPNWRSGPPNQRLGLKGDTRNGTS